MQEKASRGIILLLLLCGTVMAAAAQEKWDITWTDAAQNPVNLSGVGDRAYMPYILYNSAWPAESRYRIWYDYASISGIAYSYSADGINWAAAVAVTGLNAEGTAPQGRPVVLYNPAWSKPYRLYYYGNPGDVWQVRVAESADGAAFTNDQLALSGGGMGTYPDGHAVAYFPGRAEPFWMYYLGAEGILYATSLDGYVFLEMGYVNLPNDPGFTAQPTQVFSLGQNDYRMYAFTANTGFQCLVSANGFDWELWENPVPAIGSTGGAGAWNDQRNYYASIAYLGEGRFILARGGRNDASGLYRTGIAFGQCEFLQKYDMGTWQFFSPFTDYKAENWTSYGSNAGANEDGVQTYIKQNTDGTVTIADLRDSGNYYLVHDSFWIVPYTVEARLRVDQATGTGADEEFPKATIACMMNDPFHTGSEAWQPAFAQTRFGAWALNTDPSADADNTQFQTYTFVCRFDEAARDALILDPNDANANLLLSVYDIYRNRDFSAPKVTFHNTGWAGWPEAGPYGRVDLGFPGPSAGVMTVDWIRWGNGAIFDPKDPGAVPVKEWSLY
ncbi:MAG TPA: hypothetical protein PK360_02750 [bacterium]|nr:hypothetical protein [bacterium]